MSKQLRIHTPPPPDSLQDLWRESLDYYQLHTGHDLHQMTPSMSKTSDCTSIHDLARFLREIDKDFTEFRSTNGKMWSCLQSITTIVNKTLEVGGGAAEVAPFPGVKVIFAAFAVLLAASKSVSQTYDVIEDVFDAIQAILDRIETHTSTSTPPTAKMKLIFVKILSQIMKILALITGYFKRESHGVNKYIPRRFRHYKIALLDDNKIRDEILNLEKLTKVETSHTIAEIHANTSNVGSLLRLQNDETISKWLSAPDSSRVHDSKFNARLKGTGEWFIQSNSTFAQWKCSNASTLWIHGKPGSGKSVICSLAIENLINEPGLAYYYFDYQDQSKRTMYALLSSLTSQLASRSQESEKIMSALYREHSRRPRPSVEQLILCLEKMLRGSSSTYIIIDALDECPRETRNTDLYTWFRNISQLDIRGAHWLITSRLEHDIRQGLNPLFSVSSTLHTHKDVASYVLNLGETDEHSRDIEKYITHGLSTIETWEDRQKVFANKELLAKADGMFLLASQQLEVLRNTRQISIRAALATLPTTLNDMYQIILESISPINAPLAQRIFQCIAFASKPLSPQELAEVFATEFGPNYDFKLCSDFREQYPEAALISTCSSLIRIVDSKAGGTTSRVVQFSHLSVREYLTSNNLAERIKGYHLEPNSSHLTLAKLCLSNLLSSNASADLPLWSYSIHYWMHHVNESKSSIPFDHCLTQLLHPTTATSLKWRSESVMGVVYDPSCRALYCSAFLGLESVVAAWIKSSPSSINKPGGPSGSALSMASRNGHTKLVNLLLQNKAFVDFQDKDGWAPLHLAAVNGHVEAARLLVEHKANVELRSDNKRVPLIVAASNGHVEVVRLMLENDASVDASDVNARTPLRDAAINGHKEVVELLIKYKAGLEARDNGGWTPLHGAATNGHTTVMRILLDHGANIEIRSANERAPLIVSSFFGHSDAVALLLERGATVDAPDKRLRTPLHDSCQSGHTELARLLLKHHANVNAVDNDGWAPLYLAVYNGHVGTARVLLENGAKVDIADMSGITPLHRASADGRTEIVRLLLEHEASVNVKEQSGWTPLHAASMYGHIEIIRLLVDHNAAIEDRSDYATSPLMLAAVKGHIDAVRLLLEKGADIDAPDDEGNTALLAAESEGYKEVADFLRSFKSDKGKER